MSAGPGATPAELELQFTRGTGAQFPSALFGTTAVTSGLQAAVTTFNDTGGPITLEAADDPADSGASLTLTPKANTPGTFNLTPTYAVPLVTSLPLSPFAGQLVFNTSTSHLTLYNGTAWVSVLLS